VDDRLGGGVQIGSVASLMQIYLEYGFAFSDGVEDIWYLLSCSSAKNLSFGGRKQHMHDMLLVIDKVNSLTPRT
jgi:hypothetical protein